MMKNKNDIILNSGGEQNVIDTFCHKLNDSPDEFYLSEFSVVTHISGVWFDFEEKIMGYIYSYKDHKNKIIDEKRFYEISDYNKKTLFLATSKWIEWNKKKISNFIVDSMNNVVYEEENTNSEE